MRNPDEQSRATQDFAAESKEPLSRAELIEGFLREIPVGANFPKLRRFLPRVTSFAAFSKVRRGLHFRGRGF